ncbi:aldo/keto reductase [Alteromonas gilva]|uniref:Aldo/keto reductase n=1 Tax=Alteromonas gilva TaxID=2987522 RepID=A0ABT5L4B1_9ALTE|nr:aldo/keto reductase [Alteromonas gilva]MDC8831882.1 aldo/keto reductase [Alteromonas gilva]
MLQRLINSRAVNAVGLGCMNLSHAYGHPPSEKDASRLLLQALEVGVDHFDTAALYGFGANEKLLGKVLKPYRQQIFLASKCGMRGVDGKRVIDGRPQTLRATIEQSLTSLQTDVLDLYYLHRWDKSVPIEESVGELSRMVDEGKIKAIGLSEVSASTLRKAHQEHPIAALQTEYSLWTRNAEISVLDTCKELGCAFVAFSPLGRGFLTGKVADASTLVDGDIRKGMPRFQHDNVQQNQRLLAVLNEMASQLHCTAGQVSLAWLLHQGKHVLPIPGTTNVAHLQENMAASLIRLSAAQLQELNSAFAPQNISGDRYPPATQAEIDTEDY